MPRPFSYRATAHELLRTSGAVPARLAAQFAAGALLGALALATAWVYTILFSPPTPAPAPWRVMVIPATTMPTTSAVATAFAASRTIRWIRVSPRGDTVGTSCTIAAGVWALFLVFLWWPRSALSQPPAHPSARVPRTHWYAFPLVCTLILGGAAALASYAIERTNYVPGDKRYLQTMLFLAVGGVLLLLWLPAIRFAPRTREILDFDGQVNVRCPRCNYLLVGLTQLRCPECGLEFTIDELIRAQKFALGTPQN